MKFNKKSGNRSRNNKSFFALKSEQFGGSSDDCKSFLDFVEIREGDISRILRDIANGNINPDNEIKYFFDNRVKVPLLSYLYFKHEFHTANYAATSQLYGNLSMNTVVSSIIEDNRKYSLAYNILYNGFNALYDTRDPVILYNMMGRLRDVKYYI